MNIDKKPLPRFWYFPNGKKAVIILTGDDHWGLVLRVATLNSSLIIRSNKVSKLFGRRLGMHPQQFLRFPRRLLTDAQAAAYTAQGFEFGLHASGGFASDGSWCGTGWPSDMPAKYASQLNKLMVLYASIPTPASERSHCYSYFGYTGAPGWTGYAGMPDVEGQSRHPAGYQHILQPNQLGDRQSRLSDGNWHAHAFCTGRHQRYHDVIPRYL